MDSRADQPPGGGEPPGGHPWEPPPTPGEHTADGHMVPPRSYLEGGPVGFGAAIKYGLRNWLAG